MTGALGARIASQAKRTAHGTSAMNEHRRLPRLPGNFAVMMKLVDVPGKPQLRGQMALSSTTNISVSGLRLKQALPLHPGSRVEVSVASALAGPTFWLRGFVVWSRQGSSGKESYAGIQLSLESSRDAASWQKFVEDRLKANPGKTAARDNAPERDPDSFW